MAGPTSSKGGTVGTPSTPSEPAPAPVAAPPVLEHATRIVSKATLVPLQGDAPDRGQAIAKYSYVSQLGLQPGEVEAVRSALQETSDIAKDRQDPAAASSILQVLASFEKPTLPSLLPRPSVFAPLPLAALQTFGKALITVRRRGVDQPAHAADGLVSVEALGAARTLLNRAVIAARGLTINTTVSPIGMLNLERLEMAPAGLERGELIATIPLAPLEETAVVQKEWSVTTKEFTSIVTDSLESYSETGVTDNTELAQSTTSQLQHSNQFNITGTVSGGIPLISGSASSGFTGQDSESDSATDSRKHATAVTQKASARAKQEHKTTISTTTVSGSSETTSRMLKNPSPTDPIRIDYFSLLRKWRVRLYRYGLRLTYDVVVPEPAGSLRDAHAKLDELTSQIGPFTFGLRIEDVKPDPASFNRLVDTYGTGLPTLPRPLVFMPVGGPVAGLANDGNWRFYQVEFDVPGGMQIQKIQLVAMLGNATQVSRQFNLLTFGAPWGDDLSNHGGVFLNQDLQFSNGWYFMHGATGHQTITYELVWIDAGAIVFNITYEPTDQALTDWQTAAWNACYSAAQAQYYAQQQEIAAQIAALQDRLNNVDTLTLRREESDEIMKSVLRSLLGTDFDFMPADVIAAFVKAGVDTTHGLGFVGTTSGLDPGQWSTLRLHEEEVRFINQAIEWENVVTYLYSYFWDVPASWDFIRQIRHQDLARQAFLRSGSARVVLTVRKGWEKAWVQFVEGGFKGATIPDDHPYLTIASEIAAYDDRNYPG